MTGKLAIKTHTLHEKYGPVVRTAPNELSFTDSSAWKTIYGQQKGRYTPFRKNYDTFNEINNQIGTNSVFLAGDEDHTRMRKVLDHAFSPQALHDQEPQMKGHAKSLLHGLDNALSRNEGVVDLNQWYTWAAFDIVTDATFNDSFHCLQKPTFRDWPLQLTKTWKLIVLVSGLKQTLPWLSLVRCVIPTSLLQKQVDRLDMVLERVRKRMCQNSDRKDFMHHIKRHNDIKTGLSEAEIISNTSLLAFAGTETVATLLPALTYMLIQSPKATKRLVDELRSSFSDENSISSERVSHINYLTACIKEGLRLFPPTPEGLPRVVPPQGAMISGQWVPGGTYVQVSNLAASLSSANFKDAKSFIPERWLPDHSQEPVQDDLQASQPFSIGPRKCVGQ
ncbi:hypothetical protein MMC28_003939, partial [Mycoblastus sanguinarius]|nr:hypothetical protein [Mycoblastus sanguinarius]